MVNVVIKGVKETISHLNATKKNIDEAKKASYTKVGLFMEGEVKASIAGQRAEPTSVDTGRLMNSVKGRASPEGAVIGTNLEYAEYIEYGTTRIKERRHFRNSLDRNRARIVETFGDEIKTSVKRT